MKRFISAALIMGLTFGVVASAYAGDPAKKLVKMTYYFHGTETAGEVDLASNLTAAAYNKMDSTEPTAPAPKSLQFTTWSGDPQMWNDCAGSYLLPVWQGLVSGRVVGNIKVTLNTISGPKAVTVQVWPDLMTQTCGSNNTSTGEYPEPAAEATVDLPVGGGETKVILKKANFQAMSFMTLMILPEGAAPGRVLYDSPDFASRVEFTCIPKSGKSC